MTLVLPHFCPLYKIALSYPSTCMHCPVNQNNARRNDFQTVSEISYQGMSW